MLIIMNLIVEIKNSIVIEHIVLSKKGINKLEQFGDFIILFVYFTMTSKSGLEFAKFHSIKLPQVSDFE